MHGNAVDTAWMPAATAPVLRDAGFGALLPGSWPALLSMLITAPDGPGGGQLGPSGARDFCCEIRRLPVSGSESAVDVFGDGRSNAQPSQPKRSPEPPVHPTYPDVTRVWGNGPAGLVGVNHPAMKRILLQNLRELKRVVRQRLNLHQRWKVPNLWRNSGTMRSGSRPRRQSVRWGLS